MSQCATNALNALVTRHLAPPLYVAMPFRNPFTTTLKQRLKHEYFVALTQELEEQWRSGKKQVKLAAIDKSKAYDTPVHTRGKTFVKFEINTKAPKKARLIQANHNEHTAYEFPEEYAAFTTALKGCLREPFEVDGVTFELHYAGGSNHQELSDLFTAFIHECPNYYYIDERDGKNWDSTMQKTTLMAELNVYKMLKMGAATAFGNRSAENRAVIRTKCGIEMVKIKYVSRWKRLSGDWNTSVGNTLISMMVCVHAITSLPTHLKPARVRALFMGDDYLGVYYYAKLPDPHDLTAALNHGEQHMGITPERGLFTDPLAVTFISLGVWPRHDGGYQFVPQPGKQLCKLFWSHKRLTPSQIRIYRSDISRSFWHTYHGFPLMMQFLKHHYDPNARPGALWDHYFADFLVQAAGNVNWQVGFVYKYRMPYSSTFFRIPKVDGAVLQHPVVTEMLRVESLDPADRRECLTRLR